MSKKTLVTGIGVLILILFTFLLSFIYFYQKNTQIEKTGLTSEVQLRQNDLVADTGSTPSEEGLAIPKAVKDLSKSQSVNKIREFDIIGNHNTLSVSKIVVYENDVVHINLIAQDADYDLSFPDIAVSQIAKKGETKILEFQAVNQGTYPFICKNCRQKSFTGSKNGLGTMSVVSKT